MSEREAGIYKTRASPVYNVSVYNYSTTVSIVDLCAKPIVPGEWSSCKLIVNQ